MILETPRLLLRPFAGSDLDDLSVLMANADFMRFSLGVFSRDRPPDFWRRFGRAIVISLIHPDNTASRRVAEKNGMTPEKETIFRGFPTIVFRISREQRPIAWLSSKMPRFD